MKPNVIKLAFSLYIFLGITSATNAVELKDLDLESAEISIVGDDSFVTRRAYYYTNQGTTEYFSNKVPQAGKKDVKVHDHHLGKYYWVSKSGDKDSCMLLKMQFGSSGLQGGNEIIEGGACWPNWKGSKANLETFMHDVMRRIRLDEGLINKQKAAGRYSKPIKDTSPSTALSRTKTFAPTKTTKDESKKSNAGDITTRLKKLKDLENLGLITKEDAARKRKEILDSL